MTIVQLDKPWVKSEFMMHGFKIKDQIDIEDLRAKCNHIYVEKQNFLPEIIYDPWRQRALRF